jgi:hypothetical protein
VPGLGFSHPGKGLPKAERSEPLPGWEVPSTPPVGDGVAPDHPVVCPSGEDICSELSLGVRRTDMRDDPSMALNRLDDLRRRRTRHRPSTPLQATAQP